MLQLQKQLLKKLLPIIFILFAGRSLAQVDSVHRQAKKPDTSVSGKIVRNDTLKHRPTATTAVHDSTSTAVKDTSAIKKADSTKHKLVAIAVAEKPLSWDKDTVFARLLTFSHKKNAESIYEGDLREPDGKEQLFYILAGLVLFVGAVKTAYPKYFQDIFKLFIQTSRRQKQTPEQIVQGYVPGFFFNILFFITGGMLVTLYGLKINYIKGPLWLLILYSAGILACVYMLKYAVTALAGMVFNVKEATGTYSFIVFLINRVVGLLLLPLLILIAFYGGNTNTVLFTIAASIIFILVIYRYALSLTVIRKNLKVSALHFFIYLCAVELMPLLVIYKVLFNPVHSK